MFELTDVKIFRDIVHGYIAVPEIFVKELIDTVWFQRLENIEQTGMRVLYPCGTHHRFSHSLGVFSLGLTGVDQLLKNFQREGALWNVSSDITCDVFWAKNKILFLIACILHDIGHTPYSHGLEMLVLEYSGKIGHEVTKQINDLENNTTDSANYISVDQISCAPHEQFSGLLIARHMKENIKRILTYLESIEYPHSNVPVYSEYPASTPFVNADHLDEDIAFIMRMIMGIKFKDYHPECQIKNSFIELLNGASFDVDKLDYVVRDTQMSGISNTNVDIERLLSGLTLVISTEYRNKTLESNQTFFDESTFFSELKNTTSDQAPFPCVTLKGELDGKITITGPGNVTLHKGTLVRKLAPPEGVSKKILKYSKICFRGAPSFGVGSKIFQGDNNFPLESGTDGSVFINNGREPFYYEISNAKVESDNVVFQLEENVTYELSLQGSNCHVSIEGTTSMQSFWFKGSIEGSIEKLSIVGDILSKSHQVPQKDAFHHYRLGYKKQSFNAISSVLDARNHLFLWIYAHHKVVYYANFLIPYWAQKLIDLGYSLNQREKNEFLPDSFTPNLTFENIEHLDDSYVFTMLKLHKNSLLKQDNSTRNERLYHELFARNYQKSLYKSFPEFDIFFSSFTNEDISKLRCTLIPQVGAFPKPYCFFEESNLQHLNNFLSKDVKFRDVVVVDANFAKSKLNLAETFCKFGDRTVAMSSISLQKNTQNTTADIQRFYIYYSLEESTKTLTLTEVEAAFSDLFQKLISSDK